jgi:uncharacterized protein YkwD
MPNLPKSLKIFALFLLLLGFSLKTALASTSPSLNFDSLRSLLLKKFETRLQERQRIVWPTQVPQQNPTNAPTRIPSPLPAVTAVPTQIQTTNYKKEYIMNAINEYRKLKGLSEVKTDSYTCSFAKTRAQEISINFNHDGFSQKVANKSLPYPSYSLITENIAMTSDYKKVAELWINSPGHAENMRQNTPFVCVENYGNYFAYEGWKP